MPSLAALAILAASGANAASPRKEQSVTRSTHYEPNSRYDSKQVEGWTVLVNKSFLNSQPVLAEDTLTLLRFQLYQIARCVPAVSVKKLRTIRIWVEEKEPHHRCLTYQPNAKWLVDNGMNPGKTRCVEVANDRNFMNWTLQQPWMVLHELSHGLHDQLIDNGFENVEIKTRYDRAIKGGRYNSVQRISGKDEKACAITDQIEYFAEASEAYFSADLRQGREGLRHHRPDRVFRRSK